MNEQPVEALSAVVVDAVLFDLDGTLVDSTGSVERAWRAVAGDLGVPFERFAPLMHGIPAAQVFAEVVPRLGADEAAALASAMNAAQAEDADDVVATPGALALLDGLPTGRWAIVTSGDRRLATARIRAAGLPTPRVLVTADDVRVGKPDPECYLRGAAALAVRPERCLVVEDSPAGVTAAVAAGMPVLGLLTTHGTLDGVISTVADLADVEAHADRLGVHVTMPAGPRQPPGGAP